MSQYARFIGQRARLRKPSPIRALMPLLKQPGVISLGGGLPNAAMFPFKQVKVVLNDGEETELELADPQAALQYSNTNGMPELLAHLEVLQKAFHGTVAQDKAEQSILVSTGSQDALTKVMELVLDEGESLLLEDYTYSGSLSFLQAYNCKLVPVRTDPAGILPSSLRTILDSWEPSQGKKPKVIYTIPTGSNPTGSSIDLERRKELYAIAQEHDLLILEDDPYYFMQFSKPWLPSLYSMDTDARVVRFDSCSKIFSSGLRIGFVTGPKELIDLVGLHMQATSLHTSGVSQSMLIALFDHWKKTLSKDGRHGMLVGFEQHIDNVVDFYRERRDVFVGLAEKHLAGFCRWRVPDAGMFLWIEVLDCDDTEQLSMRLIQEEKVLVVAGTNFHPRSEKSCFIRVAYSTASDEQMDDALARFARLLQNRKN